MDDAVGAHRLGVEAGDGGEPEVLAAVARRAAAISVIRREPSACRASWTMTSTALLIWSLQRLEGDLDLGHRGQGLQPHQRVLGAVGVDGGERAVVAGGHGLEHVEGLAAADLADDDAVGAHAQRVADQVADGDPALALDVGRPGLQADDVLLLELEFGGVLDGDDALAVRDQPGEGVEQGGLAGAGAAGDDDVELGPDEAPASSISICSSSEPRPISSWSV